jgi:hypothetical protein
MQKLLSSMIMNGSRVTSAPIYIFGPQVGPNGGAVPATFGADMQAKYGQSSIMVIPRWATRIYFDVGLPAENEKEHNSFYGPNCIGAGQGMQAMGRGTSLILTWNLVLN